MTVGIFDRFRRPITYPFDTAADELGALWNVTRGANISIDLDRLTSADMWRTQPHLRTVTTFLGRNVAQCRLHHYRAKANDDRKRQKTSDLSKILRRPNSEMTGYELIEATVIDLCIYEEGAYWYVQEDPDRPDLAGYSIVRIPPAWVTPVNANAFQRKEYKIQAPGGDVERVDASLILHFHGYSPTDTRKGATPIDALKEILREQLEASQYRRQVWKRGGRVSSVLTRPVGAPRWSSKAKERFRDDWYAQYAGNGPKAGGTPILDDGMTLQKVDFSAADQQYVEGSKLSFTTVCSVYHVNPSMVGLLDNANFSSTREFRKALYGDTLGPIFNLLEDRINVFGLPMLGVDDERDYVEFNIKEKLQGDFEAQAKAMQSAVGGPWMLRSEARAVSNLPAIDGADELIVPLNVTQGGQASPNDTGTQNETGDGAVDPAAASQDGPPHLSVVKDRRTVHVKAAATQGNRDDAAWTLRKFFERQERVVRARMGAKSRNEDWWDTDRWDEELSVDLLSLAQVVATEIGRDTAVKLGFEPMVYDRAQTLHFLSSVTKRIASSVNAATRIALADAEKAPDPATAIDVVWNTAKGNRSVTAGAAIASTCAGFGTVEACRQIKAQEDGLDMVKTWDAGKNPRPAHAKLNGETVPVDQPFSNGAMWPADFMLDADEIAGCNCSVNVRVS